MAKIQPAADSKQPLSPVDPTYTFRFRQHKTGNFHGLWELTLVHNGSRGAEMLTDADALTNCVNLLQGRLENDGF